MHQKSNTTRTRGAPLDHRVLGTGVYTRNDSKQAVFLLKDLLNSHCFRVYLFSDLGGLLFSGGRR